MPLGLLTSVVLARLLGADNLGLYSVLVNFATVAVLLSLFGWPSAVIYRVRSARTRRGSRGRLCDPEQSARSDLWPRAQR